MRFKNDRTNKPQRRGVRSFFDYAVIAVVGAGGGGGSASSRDRLLHRVDGETDRLGLRVRVKLNVGTECSEYVTTDDNVGPWRRVGIFTVEYEHSVLDVDTLDGKVSVDRARRFDDSPSHTVEGDVRSTRK